MIPGRVFRYFQEISGSIPTTTGSGTRIWDIPKGFDIRNILLKTGTKATNVTGGNNSFATLTEFLSDIRINMGLGRYIRRYLNSDAAYFDLAESYNLPFGRIPGVTLIDFAQFGNLGEVLNTRGMVSGPTGNVDLYVSADVVGAANQAVVGAIEEIRFRPIIQAGA